MNSSATGDLNIGKASDKRGYSEPGYSPDPLAGLSHSPIMRDRGLYVDGGISEFSAAFLAPMQTVRESMEPGESLVDFVKRSNGKDPEILRKLAYAALPERLPVGDEMPSRPLEQVQNAAEKSASGRSVPVFMRGVMSLLFHKPA